MAAEIPAAESLALSPAKHQGPIEHHARFDEAVAAFVRRCSSAAGATTVAQKP